MDTRGHGVPGYPHEMLDFRWDLGDDEDEAAPEDIRLRGPESLKEDMELIAALQSRAMKDFLKRRRGMSANRLWLSIAQNFRMAFVAKFGPLPDSNDELAMRQYAERVAAAMTKYAAEQARRK